MSFSIIKKSNKSQARTAILKTAHGQIQTPFFMPIATAGAVKTLSAEDLKHLGAQIILSNTYHLLLRPGLSVTKKSGGLHNFMNWPGPILTDSGGFQVYSLSKIRQVTDKGVIFHSPIDGQKFTLAPKKVQKIQQTFGSDIMMVLDQCVGYPATRREVEKAVERTTLWARNFKQAVEKSKFFAKSGSASAGKSQKSKVKLKVKSQGSGNKRHKVGPSYELRVASDSLIFAINQGGIYKDLRLKSAQDITKLNFDGYALGGLAVGEPWSQALKVLDWVIPELPEDKPRYLMGVGYPEQIIKSVTRGIDMFDCVIPTREARHGKLFLWKRARSKGQKIYQLSTISNQLYHTIQIQNSCFTRNFSSINKESKIPELRQYSLAYLRHLFKIKEPLAQRLATLNNLEFYLNLMSKIRQSVSRGFL